MCPTDKEIEDKILDVAPPGSEDVEDLETKEDMETKDSKDIEKEDTEEEAEFEGVDRLQDIPKGKEKNYGI